MYEKGELVIYGSVGVCRIEDITTPDFCAQSGKDDLYYVLSPLFQSGMIYAPVESKKIFMRPVISRKEADELIDMIPRIRVEAYHNRSTQLLVAHYEKAFESHSCADLVELIMSIYSKKQSLAQQRRKFGNIDSRFMKRAEDMLYGELSVVYGIEPEQVQSFIASRVADAESAAVFASQEEE